MFLRWFIHIIEQYVHSFFSQGPYTGGSMNPALSLGGAFANRNFREIWVRKLFAVKCT